jgi:Transposase DDE domain
VLNVAPLPGEIAQKDLHHWRLLEVFREVLAEVSSQARLHPSFADPRRELGYAPYLSLFLFGLFNPVVESMRGLCSVSRLEKVQQSVGCSEVSLGSFSEAQSLLEPALLHKVFQSLYERVETGTVMDERLRRLNLVIQDGSLWRALPRMAWAEYGVGPKGQAKGVRLHLRFHLLDHKPLDARVTTGKGCERRALREMCVAGQTNVGDRYYGLDYKLFQEIDQAKGYFVFRIKEDAVVHVDSKIPLSQADQAAGVVRHVWARLGAHSRSIRLRLVEIQTADQHLLLVTNLPLEQAPAELVGTIYRHRWAIELFFRWIKCILKCRHFFAESPQGVALQLYLALIASLLFQLFTGRRPTKRIMEFIQMYQMGWATAGELHTLLHAELATPKQRKKS